MLAAAEAGQPQAIALLEKAPRIEHPYYWHAFADLTTERQQGMGVGPIPYSAIQNIASEDNLSPTETAWLHYIIRALDNHYLDKQAKRLAKQSKPSAK